MNKFVIPKDSSVKIIFLLMFFMFIVFYFVMKDSFCLVLASIFVIGYLAIYCQREIEVEIGENSLKITKLPSKVLPRTSVEIPFKQISRISQVNAPYRAFIVVRVKDGLNYNLPMGLNPELDKSLFDLDSKLKADDAEYGTSNAKIDNANSKLRNILFIILFFTVIIDVAAIFIILKGNVILGITLCGLSAVPIFILALLLAKRG